MYLCRLPEPQDSRPGVTAGRDVVSSLTVGVRKMLLHLKVTRLGRLTRNQLAKLSKLTRHLLIKLSKLTRHPLTLSLCRLLACR